MEKYYSDKIWLTGSRRTITRLIYKDNDKYFIKWYGDFIEVHDPNSSGWKTVEDY